VPGKPGMPLMVPSVSMCTPGGRSGWSVIHLVYHPGRVDSPAWGKKNVTQA
jgi:hypothetical protein